MLLLVQTSTKQQTYKRKINTRLLNQWQLFLFLFLITIQQYYTLVKCIVLLIWIITIWTIVVTRQAIVSFWPWQSLSICTIVSFCTEWQLHIRTLVPSCKEWIGLIFEITCIKSFFLIWVKHKRLTSVL